MIMAKYLRLNAEKRILEIFDEANLPAKVTDLFPKSMIDRELIKVAANAKVEVGTIYAGTKKPVAQ